MACHVRRGARVRVAHDCGAVERCGVQFFVGVGVPVELHCEVVRAAVEGGEEARLDREREAEPGERSGLAQLACARQRGDAFPRQLAQEDPRQDRSQAEQDVEPRGGRVPRPPLAESSLPRGVLGLERRQLARFLRLLRDGRLRRVDLLAGV